MVLQCQTHGLQDNVLLQNFYRSLDSVNKGVTDQLSLIGLMQHPYEITFEFLDYKTNINRARSTREDQVSPITY